MSRYVNDFVNNTQTFQINDARQLPIIVPSPEKLQQLYPLFQEALCLKKDGNTATTEGDLKKVEDKIEKLILELYQMV